jgi:hypothetical protein
LTTKSLGGSAATPVFRPSEAPRPDSRTMTGRPRAPNSYAELDDLVVPSLGDENDAISGGELSFERRQQLPERIDPTESGDDETQIHAFDPLLRGSVPRRFGAIAIAITHGRAESARPNRLPSHPM